MSHQLDKMLIVFAIEEERCFPVPAIENVMQASIDHDSTSTRHRIDAGLVQRTCRLLIPIMGLMGTVPACTPPPAQVSKPSVLLVTIDTLRADRVGRGMTPAIDALAREGVTFTGARANVPLTLPSHATIMTGLLPPDTGVRENGVHRYDGRAPTLARRLRDRGYRTAAFVGAYVLDRRFGLADGFEHYDDRIPRDPARAARLEAERSGDKVVGAARDWLERADRSKPIFVWVHLYDPHAPYTPPSGFLQRARGNAYDGEVAFADAQVASLLQALRAKRGTNLLIAIAGDHGEGLGEHGETTHGMLAYDSTLKVPMILSGPGVPRGTRVERPVTLRDLPATVLGRIDPALGRGPGFDRLAAAGSGMPEAAADVLYAESTYPRVAGWSPLRVLVDDRWKVIGSSGRELYDLVRDPGEQHDVGATNPSIVAAMSARADRLFSSSAGKTSPVSAAAAERLRALGYVAVAPSAPETAGGGPNPRDQIAAWNRFEHALSLLTARPAADALPALRALAAQFPDARVFQSTYAQALKDAGRAGEASRIYRRLVTRWPGDATLFHDLAVAAREAGDAREAIRAEQAAIALDPEDPNAQNGLGLLHAEAGRVKEAAAAFERAATLDPNNASFWANMGNARRAQGDLAGAERSYTRALEIDARHPDAANGMGVVRVQQRRSPEAVRFFELAAAADPALYEAQLNLGIALQESGERERAAEQYRKVVAIAPPGSREKKAASALLAALR